jgi:hypothetical protein
MKEITGDALFDLIEGARKVLYEARSGISEVVYNFSGEEELGREARELVEALSTIERMLRIVLPDIDARAEEVLAILNRPNQRQFRVRNAIATVNSSYVPVSLDEEGRVKLAA